MDAIGPSGYQETTGAYQCAASKATRYSTVEVQCIGLQIRLLRLLEKRRYKFLLTFQRPGDICGLTIGAVQQAISLAAHLMTQ